MIQGSLLSIVIGFLLFAQQVENPLPFEAGELPLFNNQKTTADPSNSFDGVIEVFSDLSSVGASDYVAGSLFVLREMIEGDDTLRLRYYFIPQEGAELDRHLAHVLKCASDQNSYWPMLNKIYENKDRLNFRSYLTFSNELTLDTNTLQSCVLSKTYDSQIDEDIQAYRQLSAVHLPLTRLGNYQLIGDQPIENIRKIINELRLTVDN